MRDFFGILGQNSDFDRFKQSKFGQKIDQNFLTDCQLVKKFGRKL